MWVMSVAWFDFRETVCYNCFILQWGIDMEQQEINKMIALFHTEELISCKWEDTWTEEEDSRTIIYVEVPEGKFVIKAAANKFTTSERVNGWIEMIENYREMGYYCPMLQKSLNGKYAEVLEVDGKAFVVWEEEFAKYSLPKNVENKPRTPDGKRFVFEEELWEFVAKVGQKHFTNTWGDSMYVRLIPVPGEKTDEVTECVEKFESLIREKTPKFIGRMERVLKLFQKNKEKLEQVYFSLPTSVFQADTWDDNVLLDEDGHFRGILDYNLSGKDTMINMALEAGWYGSRGVQWPEKDENTVEGMNRKDRDAWLASFMISLRVFRNYYDFTETEAEAMTLLYRYVLIYYDVNEAVEKHFEDTGKMNLIFDFLEEELTRTDIDFRSAMLK